MRIIELLGLKNDFETNYLPTVENQTEPASSSSATQTRKRKIDSNNISIDSQKRTKGNLVDNNSSTL